MPKKKKSLIETNPYLRDPKQREELLIWSVATSTAIETGASPESIARELRAYCHQNRQKRQKAKKNIKTRS